MKPDEVWIRDLVAESVVEHLSTTSVVQALAAVQFAYAGCDEVRIVARLKSGEPSVQFQMYRDGVQLGEFGS